MGIIYQVTIMLGYEVVTVLGQNQNTGTGMQICDNFRRIPVPV
jgi:hypothetical protein